MDRDQSWNWPQQGRGGGYWPPISGGQASFGMQYDPPFNFDRTWSQPAAQTHQQNNGRTRGRPPFNRPGFQYPFPQNSQTRPQYDGRGRDQSGPPRQENNTWPGAAGDFYRPRADRQNRQHEGRAWNESDYRPRRARQQGRQFSSQDPRPQRAPAPLWGALDNPPAPFSMDNPAAGPFGSTRPLRQSNTVTISTATSNATKKYIPLRKTGARAGFSNRRRNVPATGPSGKASSSEPISAPSAASGGVPEPTAEYLERASLAACQLDEPKPTLVVIDLNGTLLYRPHRRNPSRFVERPHARDFLRRCIDQHHVVIWSSARPENVRRMLSQLLSPDYLSRVIAVWGRDRFGLTEYDYNQRTQCYKRLTRLWEDPIVAASHPQAADGIAWNQANTVLIDDSAEKARSEPHNAVTLPEFVGDLNERPRVLPLVEEYLDTLTMQLDVSTYIKVNPFTMVDSSSMRVAVVEEGEK
ncbi:HAD-like domain-containing protein [Corynascus similis CBS 632.67]